eukprot:6195117-Pleurochrysis_carterae.AAC.1
MQKSFASHAKVVAGVAAGKASCSWLYTNLCTFFGVPRCTLVFNQSAPEECSLMVFHNHQQQFLKPTCYASLGGGGRSIDPLFAIDV